MKRSFVAILALCAAPVLAQAQGGGFGVKGGLSYGNVSNGGALPGSVTRRSGLAAGISLATGGLIGFGIEGLYAQRGVTSTVVTDSHQLDYIDVPVYLRIALPTAPISPFVYAGPQASYELKCGSDGGTCPIGPAEAHLCGRDRRRRAARKGQRRLLRGPVCLRPYRPQAEHRLHIDQLQDALVPAVDGSRLLAEGQRQCSDPPSAEHAGGGSFISLAQAGARRAYAFFHPFVRWVRIPQSRTLQVRPAMETGWVASSCTRPELTAEDKRMLMTLVVVLVALWLLGLVTSYTMGGLIHILLVIAIVVVLVRVIQGRRVV